MARRGIHVIGLFFAIACSSEEGGGGDPGSGDSGPEAGGDAAPLVGPCASDAAIPETGDRTLSHGGLERAYRLHIPDGYDRAPTALVLNFHGFTSSSAEQELFSEMSLVANREGFAVVYPQGTGLPRSFNAGLCCGSAVQNEVDDVAFTGALIDAVAAEMCLDPARVYSTGFSNGGFMSHRLACELSDRIAAIAPVAGVLGVSDCDPPRAVPVLHFHGTLDGLVPFEGGGVGNFPSVNATVDHWSDHDGCAGDAEVSFEEGDARCDSWQACDDGSAVELCVIDGGGHTWPGGQVPAAAGKTSRDISASDRMWQFFRDHPMPAQ